MTTLFFILPLLLYSLAMYLSWRDLRYGLILVIITLPLNNRILFDLGLPQLLPVRLVLMALFLVAGARFVQSRQEKTLRDYKNMILTKIKNDYALFLLLVLLLVRIVSLQNAVSVRNSLPLLLFFIAAVVLYIIIKFLYDKYGIEYIVRLFYIHSWVVVGTTVFSLIQLLFFQLGDRVIPGVWPSATEPTRFGSTFWDINHYAPYVGSVIPYFLLKTIYSKTHKERIKYLTGFVLTNVAMVMTLSRSGWLGYAFGLAVLGLILIYLRLRKAFVWYGVTMLAMTVVTVIGVLYFQLPVAQRLYSLTTYVYNESRVAHLLLNRAHFEIFSKYPVIGGGYGSFGDQFRETSYALKYYEIDPVEDVRLPSHSVWFEVLSETGLLGFTVYTMLVSIILRQLLRASRRAKNDSTKVLNIAIFAGVSGMLFSSIFYHYNLEYFWMILFFAVFIPRLVIKNEKYELYNYVSLIGIVGIATYVVFPNLGRNALIDWDESIYAQIAKNMIRYRDWITMRWHMNEFWFEKPPLYMWLTSLMYVVYETSEFAARFWSAISGVFGAVAVYFLGRDMFNKAVGFASALTLLSTVHWVFQSRNGTLDVLVATLIVYSMWFFYRARNNPREWRWVGLFLGLTLMTKGVVVLIPLVSMGIFAAIELTIYKKKSLYPIKRILLNCGGIFGIVVLPWHLISLYLYGKDFVDSYFIYHVLQRTQGIEGHDRNFLWYLIVIKVWARHNIVLLLGALGLIFVKWWKAFRNSRLPDVRETFLLVWLSVTLLIFSASVTKIQWYIMPIYPVMSLIIGYILVTFSRKINPKLVPILLVLLMISVPFFKERYRRMWDIEDSWRGVAEVVPHMKYEARKVKNPQLMIVDMSPGPAMYYSDYPTITTTFSGVVSKAEGDKAFFAVGRVGQAEDLVEMYPEKNVKIFKQYEDFALFGRL